MKKALFALLALFAIASITGTSCHKTKQSSPASPLSGLTGLRHRTYVDTGMGNMNMYVKWNFSGTSPILVTPVIDTMYATYAQLNFTDANVTQVVYHEGHGIVLTTNISYNAKNQIDTMTFRYQNVLLGATQMAFQYSGDHITQITSAPTTNTSDTFLWSQANTYFFKYTGDNISAITWAIYNGPGSVDSMNYTYFSGSRTNNFAGSLTTFLTSFYTDMSNDGAEIFPLLMPYYMNPDIVESTGGVSGTSTIVTTLTGPGGRIAERVIGGDTTFYYY